MTSIWQFLASIALSIALALGGHHYWLGQYGANFNADASLDTSQVIDATGDSHGLFAL